MESYFKTSSAEPNTECIIVIMIIIKSTFIILNTMTRLYSSARLFYIFIDIEINGIKKMNWYELIIKLIRLNSDLWD